ncbi:uncharacterized protein N7498_006706 [Penicillium cinerascens]|uniref:Uncharacterized protein n=1 Tax=Penicillium cinerascens TaxID=70096 RepID=A0A9W9MIN2_9EURO|nr:uncharacterized protein N7498_006706 [Penicillium cinerascens]KAJ5202043.1 hypothetical protein N7498_006706 [Penicillium cinerascens]
MPTQKPELPPLKTPKSFTFPSEIQDDRKALSIEIKHEDNSSSGSEGSIPTPLAYTEFLSALTPVFESPKGSAGSFPKFSFEKSGPSPISQPSTATSPAFSSAPSLKSPSVSLPPPSPCNVKSPRNPPALRRLRIPQSLKTLSMKDSPRTATPLSGTPYSANPYSANPYSTTPRSTTSSFWASSPREWQLRGLEPRSATTPKAVSVRHVVTRTVTYKRTPLDPPPKGKGKRRKTQECKET